MTTFFPNDDGARERLRLTARSSTALQGRREGLVQGHEEARPSTWRRRGTLAALTLASLAAATLAVWLLPIWLTQHPRPQAAEAVLQAQNEARRTTVALLAGAFAGVSIFYTARTYRLSQRTQELARDGVITDRYSKAVEQLGHASVEVRLGGIFALERLARDSVSDAPTIAEVLSAFVRSRAGAVNRGQRAHHDDGAAVVPEEDVAAAVLVLARRDPSADQVIDLRSVSLRRIRLRGARFSHAAFMRADLSEALLEGADLSRAVLTASRLDGAVLSRADLQESRLNAVSADSADFSAADLGRAKVAGSSLVNARFTGASLMAADFTGSDLSGASLDGASCQGCRFTAARIGGVKSWRGADLAGAIMDAEADVDATALMGAGALGVDRIVWVKWDGLTAA